MSVYAIGDPHLSLGSSKPMDVFPGWENYIEKLRDGFAKTVSPDDTVVICGDISWGLTLEDALEDFLFLDSLPGKKIILKGNHDYYFQTKKKTEDFFEKNGIKSMKILHNNAFAVENIAVCGTRGWMFEEAKAATDNDKKILLREAGRLRMSIQEAVKTGLEPVVFMHYPPVYAQLSSPELLDVLDEFEIRRVFYGHIHAEACAYARKGYYRGVDYTLVSCDYLNFVPILVE